MIRLISLIAILSLAAVSGTLYKLKYKVQSLDRESLVLQRQILAEREAIRLLDADWAYLNQPDRLQVLAERHLTLGPIDPRQFAMIASIPARIVPLADVPVASLPLAASPVKLTVDAGDNAQVLAVGGVE